VVLALTLLNVNPRGTGIIEKRLNVKPHRRAIQPYSRSGEGEDNEDGG